MNATSRPHLVHRPSRFWTAVSVLAVLLSVGPGACTGRQRVAAPQAPAAVARPGPPEVPDSVLWMRTAVERRALALEVYRQASAMLDRALADPSWTAALEQGPEFATKPPAVILDVDETVLDNSEFEERLARSRAAYGDTAWTAWCEEARAPAIPGAVDFTRQAAARGVTVFFVTNRDHGVEQATRRNLVALGFPVDGSRDTVLTLNERPGWTAETSTRRTFIAAGFRILLLAGDDFGDFIQGARDTLEARRALADLHADMWGIRWIVLPNPMYGSWKTAATR